MRRSLRACIGVVLLLAAGAAPARASLDSDGTTVVAFSDTHPTPFADVVPDELSVMKAQYCAGPGDRGPARSLRSALRAADHLVSADSHGRGLRAVSHSQAANTERRALATAAGALGAGKPAAALAALLHAHTLARKDPVPLIDAAPLLSEAGQGRAALALLGAAAKLRAPKTHPFGISWSAIAANNKGQALIVMHRFGAAQKQLSHALKAAPLLREAEQNLALAEDCAGKRAPATQALFLAVRRQRFASSDFVEKTPGDPFGQLDGEKVLDTSRGATLVLPALVDPKTMDEGKEQQHANFSLQQSVGQDEEGWQAQLTRDQQALNAQLAHANPATVQRTQDIMAAPVYALFSPRLRGMYNKALNLQTEMGNLELEGVGGQTGCSNAGLHGQWLSTLQAYDTVQRNYAAAEYKLETGMAANLKNPVAHRVVLDQARFNADSNFFLLVGEEGFLDDYDAICDQNNPQGTVTADSGKAQMPITPACPSGIVGPGFTINLLVLSFSVDCEQVKAGITVGEGWLNAFVSVSHNFRNGSNTIFAGPQVGIKFGVGPFEGGAAARGGVYVTFGSGGAIQDAGLRSESTVGATIPEAGGASLSGPHASISVAGAFTPPL